MFSRNLLFRRLDKYFFKHNELPGKLGSNKRGILTSAPSNHGRFSFIRTTRGQQLTESQHIGLTLRQFLPCVPNRLSDSFYISRSASIYQSNNKSKLNRPKAQSTVDEEEVKKFSALSQLWWDETGVFEALHSMNVIRVPFIRDGLKEHGTGASIPLASLHGLKILDVGSGGGILTEPLARLGATVIGIDASEENVQIAQTHLRHDPSIVCKVKYINSTVEDMVVTEENKFDAVVASEVVEHVADIDTFIDSCCTLVKPGGSLFLTTINKTVLSYLFGVFFAERVLHLVAPGTHDWNKFISPLDLQYLVDQNGFTTRLIHGMKYNPVTKVWSWSSDSSINYATHAIKTEEKQ